MKWAVTNLEDKQKAFYCENLNTLESKKKLWSELMGFLDHG